MRWCDYHFDCQYQLLAFIVKHLVSLVCGNDFISPLNVKNELVQLTQSDHNTLKDSLFSHLKIEAFTNKINQFPPTFDHTHFFAPKSCFPSRSYLFGLQQYQPQRYFESPKYAQFCF